MQANKVFDMFELSQLALRHKQQGEKIVLCHGTFDLMHTGHIRYLQAAKKNGEKLFVTLTADEHVNKGPGRPVFNADLRAENLAALECVDYVAINNKETAVNVIRLLRPDFYVKGSDYKNTEDDVTGNIKREIEITEKFGGSVVFTDEIVFSSSKLLNDHFGVFPAQTRYFLTDFGKTNSCKDILSSLDQLAKLKVLVIGDAIIDQYHYVSPLGQTGKGNVLAVQYDNNEQFAGGSLAVANHVAQFAQNVTLLTALGDHDSHEDYVRAKLSPNVNPVFAYFKDAPTVTKRRFVDGDLAKLFEVYFFKDNPQIQDLDEVVLPWMKDHLSQFDVVIVADFGNGFINNKMIPVICEQAPFLAVNTQINSGNRGFHVINRYTRADYVSLNEPELRLAAHNRMDDLEQVCQQVADKLGVSHFAVTRGTKGVVTYDAAAGQFHKVPALSSRVIDRIGAGDAFLSLSSLCLAGGISSQVAGFVGSVAAAMDVQIVCNREPIDPVGLKKYITTLLK
jgi:rfaE bifunctional protein nucleotidyltransferase chain/domain